MRSLQERYCEVLLKSKSFNYKRQRGSVYGEQRGQKIQSWAFADAKTVPERQRLGNDESDLQ